MGFTFFLLEGFLDPAVPGHSERLFDFRTNLFSGLSKEEEEEEEEEEGETHPSPSTTTTIKVSRKTATNIVADGKHGMNQPGQLKVNKRQTLEERKHIVSGGPDCFRVNILPCLEPSIKFVRGF